MAYFQIKRIFLSNEEHQQMLVFTNGACKTKKKGPCQECRRSGAHRLDPPTYSQPFHIYIYIYIHILYINPFILSIFVLNSIFLHWLSQFFPMSGSASETLSTYIVSNWNRTIRILCYCITYMIPISPGRPGWEARPKSILQGPAQEPPPGRCYFSKIDGATLVNSMVLL